MNDLIDRLQWFPIVIWAIVPPLSMLLLWHRRVRAAPALNGAIALFAIGMLAGVAAWGLETIAHFLIRSSAIELPTSTEQSSEALLFSLMLWQIGIVAPTAELMKLLAVLLPLQWLIRRHGQLPAQPSTVLLATIAVSLGFAAQDSLGALWYDRALVGSVVLKMVMQAIFSMAWGFTLGFALCRLPRHIEYSANWVRRSWIAACLCHGAWNSVWLFSLLPGRIPWKPLPILEAFSTWELNINWTFVRYALLPWGLWLWWQTERMLQRSQGEQPLTLIRDATPIARLRQILCCLGCALLGGVALNSLLNFSSSLQQTWELRVIFDRAMAEALAQEGLWALLLTATARYTFHQLYRQALTDRR